MAIYLTLVLIVLNHIAFGGSRIVVSLFALESGATQMQVGILMGGAILTESVFSWPGIGKWLVESIGRRDYPALQGGVLVIAALVMAANLAVDLLYGVLNPRIRHKR